MPPLSKYVFSYVQQTFQMSVCDNQNARVVGLSAGLHSHFKSDGSVKEQIIKTCGHNYVELPQEPS